MNTDEINIEYNLIWLQAINEIVRLNPNMKKKYFKIVMKMIFSKQIDEYNKFDKDIKEEINKTIINCISIFTNECEEIFQCDSYFQNLTHLKNLLKLFIIDLFLKYIESSTLIKVPKPFSKCFKIYSFNFFIYCILKNLPGLSQCFIGRI